MGPIPGRGTGGVVGVPATVPPVDMGVYNKPEIVLAEIPGTRQDNQWRGRPGMDVDFAAVCNAVRRVWNGSWETVTDTAERFGVSREWTWKRVYPGLEHERPGDQPQQPRASLSVPIISATWSWNDVVALSFPRC